jgi:hypothetical protein
MQEYRVWCKNKQEYEKHAHFLDQHGQLWKIIAGNLQAVREETHIVEWCTGLTDKHGDKIFESDKVRAESGEVAIVVFKEGAFLLERQNGELAFMVGECIKRIGNVHDRSEE